MNENPDVEHLRAAIRNRGPMINLNMDVSLPAVPISHDGIQEAPTTLIALSAVLTGALCDQLESYGIVVHRISVEETDA